jgi:hypothetical protein
VRVWSEEESCEVSERMSTSTAALQYLLKFQENVVHRARRAFHNRDEVLTVPVDLTRRERVRGRGRSTRQSAQCPLTTSIVVCARVSTTAPPSERETPAEMGSR